MAQLTEVCSHLFMLLFRNLDDPRFPATREEAAQVLTVIAGRAEDDENHVAARMLAEIAARVEG